MAGTDCFMPVSTSKMHILLLSGPIIIGPILTYQEGVNLFFVLILVKY